MSLLNISELSICYGDKTVVDKLTFKLEAGESVGLVGESGSGKTQTALAVLGLLPASAVVSGSIEFDGQQLLGKSSRDLDALRAIRLSMVFQDPAEALNPYLRIGEQLRRILIAHQLANAKDADTRVRDMLRSVGLSDPDRQFDAYPHQLSGGMRQRAMIASALIAQPDLLIADEPTTALDVTVQAQILALLDSLRQDTALLLITHDLGVVASHCERMLVLREGRLLEAGDTVDVFRAPQAAHTESLIRAAPRVAAADAPLAAGGSELLRVAGASISYRASSKQQLHAVKSVDLTLKSGETLAIVGESGSGKSSLARAILGLVRASGGTISYLGSPLAADARHRDSRVRRDLQLVFQDPVGSLNPQMRVDDIVLEPLRVHEPALGRSAGRDLVREMLEKVGLGDEFAGRYPHELSGGQAQRVAIARALVVQPKVLVCDEAVAALDGTVRQQILSLLQSIQADSGLAILFISHDLGVVCSISHRVIVMYLGQVVEAADSRTLFAKPLHPYTRALLDAVPIPDPAALQPKPLAGEVPSSIMPPDGCAFHPRCPYVEQRCIERVPEQIMHGTTSVRCHRAGELELV